MGGLVGKGFWHKAVETSIPNQESGLPGVLSGYSMLSYSFKRLV